MEKNKIYSIRVVGNDRETYKTGEMLNGKIIAKIIDQSVEYPDRIYTFYEGFDIAGNIMFRIENAPRRNPIRSSPLNDWRIYCREKDQ